MYITWTSPDFTREASEIRWHLTHKVAKPAIIKWAEATFLHDINHEDPQTFMDPKNGKILGLLPYATQTFTIDHLHTIDNVFCTRQEFDKGIAKTSQGLKFITPAFENGYVEKPILLRIDSRFWKLSGQRRLGYAFFYLNIPVDCHVINISDKSY